MMKKPYAKPMLYAESFALVEHIAGGCAHVTNFGNQCPISEAGVVFFTSEAAGCNGDGISMIEFQYGEGSAANVTVEQLIGMNIQCYNSFADFSLLFTSA